MLLYIDDGICHLLQIGNFDFLSIGATLLGFYAVLQIHYQTKIGLDIENGNGVSNTPLLFFFCSGDCVTFKKRQKMFTVKTGSQRSGRDVFFSVREKVTKSRFGRNYIETGRYLERIFPFMGVRFIAINDHYDSAEENDDKGRILIPFNNLINDTYCRDISLRVRSHLDVKRKEGQFIGSFAGYGYRKDPKDKNHLIIDEYAAGIVQEIFKQKLNGMSSQRIASHLNELGVLPPNEYKRANGFNYTCGFQAGLNQKWTVVSVNRILKNESYTGTLIQGKRRKINYKVKKSHDVGSENWIRVEDAHDAIISKGEFQQVQQLLELDTRTAPSQTTVYPLSGFLRCADCGQNMIRRTVTKNGKKYQYYHCSTYKNGGGCTPHMINSEKLTESVLAAIRHQVTLLVEAEKVLSNAELASGEQIGIKILDSQITALEAELERYSNLKIRLYQDLCDDVVSREEYGEMNTRFAQKIKEAQDKIQEIREKKQEALKHDTLLPTWLEEFKQYEHIKTLERRVVVELIDHIDVHSKTEIEIHFCFEDELHSITEKFMEYSHHLHILQSRQINLPAFQCNRGAASVGSQCCYFHPCCPFSSLRLPMISGDRLQFYHSF